MIVTTLLSHNGINSTEAINKSGETALDTAVKTGRSEIATILQDHGVRSAKSMKAPPSMATTARELKQTVSDIKHGVHHQLEHTHRTQKRVQGIGKQLNKMHAEGLNNVINSTTVVAVLIATVTFAAIFTVPGQYADGPNNLPSRFTLGETNITPKPEFIVFLISDSLELFISLAVVVIQMSIVVVDRKAKKQLMEVISKLMWLASAFVSVAFLSLSYVVVGYDGRWLAVAVTVIGSVIMVAMLGTMSYQVIVHRMEDSNLRSIRKSSRSRKSKSWSVSVLSDSENDEFKKLNAI